MKLKRYFEISNAVRSITDNEVRNIGSYHAYNFQLALHSLVSSEPLAISPYHFDSAMDVIGAFVESDSFYKVYYDDREYIARQNFTKVHEIGHYILHKGHGQSLFRDGSNSVLGKTDDPIEIEANVAASMLLLPDVCLIYALQDGWNFEQICSIYGISKSSLFVRLQQVSEVYFHNSPQKSLSGAKIIRYRNGPGRVAFGKMFGRNLETMMTRQDMSPRVNMQSLIYTY
ncbi:hypothetical protein AZI11_08405 [Levilactobacillus brevis]|uniref:ImmA/IrrE family metallo-endopeptidase n=1 Tax=Levilactobacillus brevis TaxID=1580 RepID=UPI000A20470E|nr:ImmA/IrrE family metallo-endopeptidase [Levilactobacillus brevis]ARN92922.1 hypothetical protein AZI11_08405 [Levilactobacillus brevis]ARN95566.1 hypothetical protein AZI12_08455 [Levilactobacillus brevis]MBS0978712.1 ImmA/IrrE family metallo-endopeptidase [Levilactobacillus brevis]